MVEPTQDLRALPRKQAYAVLIDQLRSILDGVDDPITAMSTIACAVHEGFGHLWTGFYRVVEPGDLLRVGPYQGPLGCIEIPFGKGVCGTAAAKRETVVVDDVETFPGHIRCDARARAEIVVPVIDSSGSLIAVFDVDSREPGAFGVDDARGLEEILGWFSRDVTVC